MRPRICHAARPGSVLARECTVRYGETQPRSSLPVNSLANIIFPHFSTTLALGGALGEWLLWCWFLGAPATMLPHLLVPFALFVVNRMAAEGCQLEPTLAPVAARAGAAVLGLGFTAFAGASALTAAAVAWALLDWALALPSPAGAADGLATAASLLPAFRPIGMAALAAGVGTMAHGYLRGHRRLRVTRLELRVAGLPASLDGFRIAQVSDLHVGPLAHRGALREAFERLMALDPDVACVTGDIADSPATDLRLWVPELARLQARRGVFVILGNHDRDAGIEQVAAALVQGTPWRLLRDQVAQVEVDGARLHIVGLEDRPSPDEARALPALLGTVPAGEPCILLAHKPDVFETAAAAGVPLTLAGHTHGGQVALPGLPHLNPARFLMTSFDGGTYKRGGCLLHVSRGLGVSGQRVRVGVPREIALVTLRRALPDA